MALDVKISFSWTNYCRLCLLDTGIMLPIFEENTQNHQLSHKIESCLQLVTYDGDPLPRRICHKCLFKVNQTYEFQKMALGSYDRLMTHLLPLKHVPEVQQYLERAEHLQRSKVGFSVTSPSPNWSTSSPISSRSYLSTTPKPKIFIKSEKDLLEGQTSSAWPSPEANHVQDQEFMPENVPPPLSLDFSPMAKSTSPMGPGEDDENCFTPPSFPNSHEDSLKRKRDHLTLESTNLENACSIPYKKKTAKKQLAGPASRKKFLQNSQWKCSFCNLNFSSKSILTTHLHRCLTCSTCQEEFCSIQEKAIHEAKKHIIVRISSDRKQLKNCCSFCPARFLSYLMLSMHLKFDHKFVLNPAQKKSPQQAKNACHQEIMMSSVQILALIEE